MPLITKERKSIQFYKIYNPLAQVKASIQMFKSSIQIDFS